MPVVDRIYSVCGSRADHALSFYDEFLGEFAKADVREACREIKEEDRDKSPIFRGLKNRGHLFSGRLHHLLQDIYEAGHPIHRALIL